MTSASDDETDELEWQLRVSHRARYAKLQIKPFGGLEVVIPPRFPRSEIPSLVARHAGWARRHLDKQSKLRNSIRLPQQLALAFDNSVTVVVYRAVSLQANYDLFEEFGADSIVVEAADQAGQRRELRNWIRRRAHKVLPRMLAGVSKNTGLSYRALSIRSQKSRWGSCSRSGNISLNDQLLFVPEKTVEYLMIHELCHTRHLNHSKKFWALVEYHCPDYRRHEKLLGQSRELVPDWFLLDLYG